MKKILKKLLFFDFLLLLGGIEGIKFTKKAHYCLEEMLSRIMKWVVKIIFFPKLKDARRKLRKIGEKGGFEEVACNLCGSRKFDAVWRKKGFETVRCLTCGLHFVTPRFNRDSRKYFYLWKYRLLGYTLFDSINALDFAINEHLINDQLLDMIGLYKKKGNLIEIGPFGEQFTRRAVAKEFKCWGIQSKEWIYDSPIEYRRYRTGNRTHFINGKKFDVVSYLDILDRIPDPRGELMSLHRLLKDDGILLIRVPNYNSRIAEKKGGAWKYNQPWERLYQFDYSRLKDLLDKSGFKIIDFKTEMSDGVGSPGCIIIVGMKKNWRMKKKNPRILVIREGAAGDVLLTTPIVKQLKKKFPESYLVFKTKYPEILQNNPYVDEITRSEPKGRLDGVFNLMYELYPDIPIIEAYEKIAQLSIEYPRIRLYLSKEEREWIDGYLKMLPLEDNKGFVVIHPMMGERIKWWNGNSYQVVSDYIRSKELGVVTVGSPMDCVELKGAMNLIRRLSLRQSAALISRGKLFIGLDSFPMHVANAFKIPSVVLFGSTDPGKILSYDCKVKVVQSSEHCLGCREDTTPDRWKQNAVCRRQRLYCMESISPGQVIEKIGEILNSSKQE